MTPATHLDALIALLDTTTDGVDGATLTGSLVSAGLRTSPNRLLHDLLKLEASGHVAIERPRYAFTITDLGREAALQLSPGRPVDAHVVVIDLVGFVAFTDENGDSAAVRAAQVLRVVASSELQRVGGRLVKHLGDGVLGTVPPETDPVEVVAAIAGRLRHDDGTRWRIRAAARAGRPIAMTGDIFGADVNLVARLCSLAAPDELVLGITGGDVDDMPLIERLEVRGLPETVPVVRIPL